VTSKTVVVDDDLWKEFRKKCFTTEVLMKKKLDELIRKYLDEEQ